MEEFSTIPKTAIIVAGGTGTRMGAEKPKQFLLLNDHPILYHTLKSFLESFEELDIVLVLPEDHIAEGQKIANSCSSTRTIRVVIGGLQQVQHDGIVMVHDGVRCLVLPDLIRSCCACAWENGSAIPVVPATDSIRMVEGNHSSVVDRNIIRLVQTPQTFRVPALQEAFAQCRRNDFGDEAAVWEAAGWQVSLVDGSHDNIKITRPVDLLIAAAILQYRSTL
jgi:2-C-methyl-D-erythritol 4-phosphate cytidylyltransferase